MQVVIDISEEMYADIKEGYYCSEYGDELVGKVKDGTPLPKGHGDLIDRSKIAFDYWSVDGHACVWKQNVFNMPVVVPADKGDEE